MRLDSVHITRTYGGCYEGRPPVEKMIERAREYAVKYFGSSRPTLVLVPKIATDLTIDLPRKGEDPYWSRDRLPDWQFIAWLDGPAKDGDFCGSQLIVIWWADESVFELPPEVLGIDWNAHAEDYDI